MKFSFAEPRRIPLDGQQRQLVPQRAALSAKNESDDGYNEWPDQLGAFVETAVVEANIDVENEGF